MSLERLRYLLALASAVLSINSELGGGAKPLLDAPKLLTRSQSSNKGMGLPKIKGEGLADSFSRVIVPVSWPGVCAGVWQGGIVQDLVIFQLC